jgi:hypothetical protein
MKGSGLDSIEREAAKVILQRPEEVVIGGETYRVSPPSTATLILVSEAVSQLPAVNLDSEDILSESLCIAKDCRAIGDVIAILILGAKELRDAGKGVKRRLWGLVTVDRKAMLAEKILEELEPRELYELMARLLKSMQLSSFFGLTASLAGVNLLRRTREAVTTASGR